MASCKLRTMSDLIKRLKKNKDLNGLSYERLAQELGVSWRTIYRWFNERTKPSLMAQKRISEYLRSR